MFVPTVSPSLPGSCLSPCSALCSHVFKASTLHKSRAGVPTAFVWERVLRERKSTCLFSSYVGLDKIEFLQSHENQEIYQKAFDLIEHYFGVEDDDSSLAPQVDETQQQFIFQQPEAPMEGFQL